MAIKRRDLILLLCLVLVGAGVLGGEMIRRHGIAAQNRATDAPVSSPAPGATEAPRNEVAVFVNGQLYAVSPLLPGETLTVTQENGSENVIRMTENGFYMETSTCDGQDCVMQGPVTHENWYTRILGNEVICLPNRVEVLLLVDRTQADAPDV